MDNQQQLDVNTLLEVYQTEIDELRSQLIIYKTLLKQTQKEMESNGEPAE